MNSSKETIALDAQSIYDEILAINVQLKQRESIAVKALEDLNKHYNTILRDAPWPSVAWHIVTAARSKIRDDKL